MGSLWFVDCLVVFAEFVVSLDVVASSDDYIFAVASK